MEREAIHSNPMPALRAFGDAAFGTGSGVDLVVHVSGYLSDLRPSRFDEPVVLLLSSKVRTLTISGMPCWNG
jgi:hypothetical protein